MVTGSGGRASIGRWQSPTPGGGRTRLLDHVRLMSCRRTESSRCAHRATRCGSSAREPPPAGTARSTAIDASPLAVKPAVTTAGTWMPAPIASTAMKPSCSTCSPPLSRAARWSARATRRRSGGEHEPSGLPRDGTSPPQMRWSNQGQLWWSPATVADRRRRRSTRPPARSLRSGSPPGCVRSRPRRSRTSHRRHANRSGRTRRTRPVARITTEHDVVPRHRPPAVLHAGVVLVGVEVRNPVVHVACDRRRWRQRSILG